MFQRFSNFSVFAFTEANIDPIIGPGLALELRLDRRVTRAIVQRDTPFERIQLSLRDLAMRAGAIVTDKSGLRQFHSTGQAAIISEQENAFGRQIQPANRDRSGGASVWRPAAAGAA